ncbi:MAG TPA: acyl-CoA dehydrogenase family protein, partial [Candidatus Thermoplasmatota archaeon]|nr:acyl-CoA dehydrogenase family protein [Candidatus Thermoplasmatota archaeon]
MAEQDVAVHFAAYLKARQAADPLSPVARAWVARSAAPRADLAWLDGFARRAQGAWARAADLAELPENAPKLRDGNVALCAATQQALAEVHTSGLWRADLDDRLRYAAVYALNRNGEGGLACSVACTDGLLRVLRRHPEGHAAALRRLEAMAPQAWAHGAQFVTEIQGGSDAGANALRASPRSDATFALHGQKWFCSNPTADLWLVTARPDGAPAGPKGLGLFLVEAAAGGFTIERLKDKAGTRALATAEIRFEGAIGRPVGPLDRGLRTMVAEVLVPSRVHNIIAVAGFLRRAEREARAYARTRLAFGRPIAEQPLVADVLARLAAAADLAEAGAFATVDAWRVAARPGAAAEDMMLARVLVSLHKAVAARSAQGLLEEAMSVLGGNGIEERFSVLPRLWRDSVILETW